MRSAFDLAAFAIRHGAEAAMLAERPAMITALRRAFPGLLAAWLTRRGGGFWLDVILWRTRAEAEAAAKHVNEALEATAWFRHAESHGLQHLDVVDHQLFAAALGAVPSDGRSTATPLDCTLQVQREE